MGRHLLRRTIVAVLAAAALRAWPVDTVSAVTPGLDPATSEQAPLGTEPAAPVPLPALQGHRGEELYSIPLPNDASIDGFVRGLLDRRRDWLQNVLERSLRWRPLIAAELAVRGMPRELQFLPAIESGFNPRAVSPVGAAGLWQLMRTTAAPYGLRMDQWLDERRDVAKATAAALAKLGDLRRQFGSWEMALAGYNCGGAKLARIVQEQKSWDYWELRRRGALPPETASFVPQFVALVRILSYPGRHGLEVPWQASPQWRPVSVARSVDLRLLAHELGVSYEELASSNPELSMPVTPPASYAYRLKVPAELGDAAERVLASDAIPLLDYRVHVVRKGDTLWGIAKSYDVALSLIMESNPGVKPEALRVGSRLLVPRIAKGG